MGIKIPVRYLSPGYPLYIRLKIEGIDYLLAALAFRLRWIYLLFTVCTVLHAMRRRELKCTVNTYCAQLLVCIYVI